MTCRACGTALSPGARYCHKCGARASDPQAAAGWRAGLPWGVAGVALGVLATVLVVRVGGGGRSAGTGSADGVADAEPAASLSPSPGAPGSPPDISQMSPEERATRLYNRVMTLHSQGKVDSAEFFLPMALQAYGMLPALDVDARYHVGVLALTGGNATAALAQADTIRRVAPTHLFGFMLRARALELAHDAPGAQRAYRDFLRNERRERARGLPEYAEHAQNLDTFHGQATQTVGRAAPRRG